MSRVSRVVRRCYCAGRGRSRSRFHRRRAMVIAMANRRSLACRRRRRRRRLRRHRHSHSHLCRMQHHPGRCSSWRRPLHRRNVTMPQNARGDADANANATGTADNITILIKPLHQRLMAYACGCLGRRGIRYLDAATYLNLFVPMYKILLALLRLSLSINVM